MSSTDTFLANNARYAEQFQKQNTPLPPGKQTAIVACMDARLETGRMLGLEEGDAHVIRNAGGVVTDDVLRSLVISQRLLGTREIILIHHTDCGMLTFKDDEVKGRDRSRHRPAPVIRAGGVFESRGRRAAVRAPHPDLPLHSGEGPHSRFRLRRRDRPLERSNLIGCALRRPAPADTLPMAPFPKTQPI